MQQIWNTWTWTKVGAQNRPATCPQGSWWVGHNQKKTWIARTLASGRRHSKLVWRFSGPCSAKILARKFSSAFDFSQTHWEKKRKNEKIRAKFGVYNSQVSCPEEAPGGASFAGSRLLAHFLRQDNASSQQKGQEAGCWRRSSARSLFSPLQGRGSSARSLFRAAYLRGKKVLGPSSRQLAWRVSAAGLQRRIGYNYINFHARPRFFVSGPPWAKLRSAPCAPAERASWSATVLPEGMVPKSRPRIDLGKKNGGAWT